MNKTFLNFEYASVIWISKLLILFISLFFSLNSSLYGILKPAYKRSDTPRSIANFSLDKIQPGKPYFPLNIYEGAVRNATHYATSDWAPYKPRYVHFADSLKDDGIYSVLNKLQRDEAFNGIIFYNNYWADWILKLQEKLVKKYDFQFFIQAYQKTNSRGHPPKEIPQFEKDLVRYDNVNWYFLDDYFEYNWQKNNFRDFSNKLREIDHNKRILAAPGIWDTDDLSDKLFDYIDIYAPQNYQCKRKLPLYENLKENIPEFYNIIKFHIFNLRFLDYVQEYNKTKRRNIVFWLTLPTYHMNQQNPNSFVHRFPTYDESRFFFYDAIICKAKGLSYYSLYQTSLKSYENIKKIIHEFRLTDFQKAVLYGKYKPGIINENSIKINKDKESKYGKRLWDIDFNAFEFEGKYYLIIANVSFENINTSIKLNCRSIKSVREKWLDQDNKIRVVESKIESSNFSLSLEPFEVKLFVLSK